MEQKQNSIPSAGTAADSGQKVEDISVCQHSSKPLVVGSQSQIPYKESVLPNADLKQKTIDVINVVNGLTPTEIEKVFEDVRYSARHSRTTISFCHNTDSFLNGYHNPNLISSCQ